MPRQPPIGGIGNAPAILDQNVEMPRNFTQLLERGYCLKRIDGECIRKIRIREVEEGLWVELVEEREDLGEALTTPVALMPRAAVAVDPFFSGRRTWRTGGGCSRNGSWPSGPPTTGAASYMRRPGGRRTT